MKSEGIRRMSHDDKDDCAASKGDVCCYYHDYDPVDVGNRDGDHQNRGNRNVDNEPGEQSVPILSSRLEKQSVLNYESDQSSKRSNDTVDCAEDLISYDSRANPNQFEQYDATGQESDQSIIDDEQIMKIDMFDPLKLHSDDVGTVVCLPEHFSLTDAENAIITNFDQHTNRNEEVKSLSEENGCDNSGRSRPEGTPNGQGISLQSIFQNETSDMDCVNSNAEMKTERVVTKFCNTNTDCSQYIGSSSSLRLSQILENENAEACMEVLSSQQYNEICDAKNCLGDPGNVENYTEKNLPVSSVVIEFVDEAGNSINKNLTNPAIWGESKVVSILKSNNNHVKGSLKLMLDGQDMSDIASESHYGSSEKKCLDKMQCDQDQVERLAAIELEELLAENSIMTPSDMQRSNSSVAITDGSLLTDGTQEIELTDCLQLNFSKDISTKSSERLDEKTGLPEIPQNTNVIHDELLTGDGLASMNDLTLLSQQELESMPGKALEFDEMEASVDESLKNEHLTTVILNHGHPEQANLYLSKAECGKHNAGRLEYAESNALKGSKNAISIPISAFLDKKGNQFPNPGNENDLKMVLQRWLCPLPNCLHSFPSKSKLKIHVLSHGECRKYKCDEPGCDWAFTTEAKLKRHQKCHGQTKAHQCTIDNCGRWFTNVYNLRTHLKLHERPLIHKCYECGKGFQTIRQQEQHMKTHKDIEKKFKCTYPDCDRSFFSSNYLKVHYKTHINREGLICKECGKAFDMYSRLRSHETSHTGERPYLCPSLGCTWAFRTSSKLSRHLLKHTQVRKFECPECSKCFFRSQHLQDHLLTHTNQKPFSCNKCDAKFTARATLSVHLRKHDDVKKPKLKYFCLLDNCSANYSTKPSLRQHLLAHCNEYDKSAMLPAEVESYLARLQPSENKPGLNVNSSAVIQPVNVTDSTTNSDILVEHAAPVMNHKKMTISSMENPVVAEDLRVDGVMQPQNSSKEAPVMVDHSQSCKFVTKENRILGRRAGKNQIVQGSARTDCKSNSILSERAQMRRNQPQQKTDVQKIAGHEKVDVTQTDNVVENCVQDDIQSNMFTQLLQDDPPSPIQQQSTGEIAASTINLKDLH